MAKVESHAPLQAELRAREKERDLSWHRLPRADVSERNGTFRKCLEIGDSSRFLKPSDILSIEATIEATILPFLFDIGNTEFSTKISI